MDCLDGLIMLIGIPTVLWVGTICLKDTAEALESQIKELESKDERSSW